MKLNTKEMRNRITVNEPDVINNQNVNSLINLSGASKNLVENNFVSEILAAEGREDFVNYIQGLGLDKDPDVIFLSSLHHYYYDAEEMKNVKTVINLKELNQVKQIKSFLHSIFHILPQKSNFIGCFVDNKKVNAYEIKNNSSSCQGMISSDEVENGIVSHIPFLNMLYSLMDSKTNKFMSGSSVSLMLEEYGFKVLNMKEINGLTYFHSQKVGSAAN
jgi:hypothetical protein